MDEAEPKSLDDSPAGLDTLWTALQPSPPLRDPVIRAVMIASIDGSTTVNGLSGPLGTPTDALVYGAMRARADLVVVGSGTALAEGYGPAVIAPTWAGRRTGPPPTVLVVTREIPDDLIDLSAAHPKAIHIAAAHLSDPGRRTVAATRGATVHHLGPRSTGTELRNLATRLAAREIALEGGPGLLQDLLEEGAVDELILSTAPEIILGGGHHRLVPPGKSGAGSQIRVPFRVASAFTGADGGLYTRWVHTGSPDER